MRPQNVYNISDGTFGTIATIGQLQSLIVMKFSLETIYGNGISTHCFHTITKGKLRLISLITNHVNQVLFIKYGVSMKENTQKPELVDKCNNKWNQVAQV